jgi:hypothetical protein
MSALAAANRVSHCLHSSVAVSKVSAAARAMDVMDSSGRQIGRRLTRTTAKSDTQQSTFHARPQRSFGLLSHSVHRWLIVVVCADWIIRDTVACGVQDSRDQFKVISCKTKTPSMRAPSDQPSHAIDDRRRAMTAAVHAATRRDTGQVRSTPHDGDGGGQRRGHARAGIRSHDDRMYEGTAIHSHNVLLLHCLTAKTVAACIDR